MAFSRFVVSRAWVSTDFSENGNVESVVALIMMRVYVIAILSAYQTTMLVREADEAEQSSQANFHKFLVPSFMGDS